MRPENENARRQPGADETRHYNANHTPARARRKTIPHHLWVLSYSLEDARMRYAASGKLFRQAAVCVALGLLRLAGVRYV